MIVGTDFSSLKETRPQEYAIRFLFGGLCTLAAGLIAKRFGPAVGGLFLAFPAIFPASASLIENHEKRRKQQARLDGTRRGRAAAAIDSAGAAIGCIGLLGFAFTLWIGLPNHNSFAVIAAATLFWIVISVSLWLIRKMVLHRIRRQWSRS